MIISDVRVRIVKKDDSKLKAVASVTFDDCFVVHDIKVIEGTEGYFIAMPSRKTGEGDYKDIAHPIKTETREELIKVILSAFEEEKATVEFECSALEFIDSTTLGTFVKILKAVKTHGFSLSFKNLKPNIKKLFLICSLDSIMEIA